MPVVPLSKILGTRAGKLIGSLSDPSKLSCQSTVPDPIHSVAIHYTPTVWLRYIASQQMISDRLVSPSYPDLRPADNDS